MMSLLHWMIITGFLFSCWLPKVKNVNILVIPMPHHSTAAESNAVAQELAKRGHRLTFYLPSDFDSKKSVPNLPIIRYGKNVSTTMLSFVKKLNDEVYSNKIDLFSKLKMFRYTICGQIIDPEAFKKLQEEKFDFAIVTFLFIMKCTYLVPYNLKIPYASISTAMTELEIGHPVAASFTPFLLSNYGTEMSFTERVINLFFHFASTIMVRHVFPVYDVSSAVPKISYIEAEDLPKKSEIFLENSDFILNFPKPTMPNFVQVGGLTTKAPLPLPAKIKKFFDEAPNGVIVMSFGSVFKPNEHTKKLFMSVFSKLEQRVFWKNDDKKQVGNIWMHSWLPQNDALAHPNTKMIIYHCGNNGMFESLYNAVPLLCLPHTVDQLSNAKKLAHFNIGKFLEVTSLSEEIVLNAIKDILSNPTYRENIKHLSSIFHSRPEKPAERAASSVEYVLKYGSKHLRSNQNKLSPFQLLNGDIWFFIFAVVTVVFIIVCFLIRKCLHFICMKKSKEKTN